MPGNYSQAVINEVARIAREQGLKYGENLKEAVSAGEIALGQQVNVMVPLG